MEEEIWKDVVGYEGLYQVSNLGRVKSLPRKHHTRGWYMTKERILSPRVCGSQREYLAVYLFGDNKHKQYKIHRLVARAFVPNPHHYKEINHIDENKGNNRADNLEWCTRSYNVNYGNGSLKRALTMGKSCVQLDDKGNILHTYPTMEIAAQNVGVDSSNISRACSIKNRKCAGYYWRLKEE